MMLNLLLHTLLSLFHTRGSLALENLALRQQLLVLERTSPKPAFNAMDRLFRVVLSRVWSSWRRPLRLVKPETVIAWHRRGWRLWWKWKSRPLDPGRPRIPYEVIELIKRISRENPTWGAPRIHGELLMLGYELSEATVARYMIKRSGRRSSSIRCFRSTRRRGFSCGIGTGSTDTKSSGRSRTWVCLQVNFSAQFGILIFISTDNSSWTGFG